jgi:hypothetical protein
MHWKQRRTKAFCQLLTEHHQQQGGSMNKTRIAMLALAAGLAWGSVAEAAPITGFQYVISYDGYLHKTMDNSVLADTLVVVNNPNPYSTMPLWLEIFDKKGVPVWEGEMWDGGVPIVSVPANGFAWITLGMVVPRATMNPF